MAWNRTVLKEVGRSIDYLAIHHYYGHDSTQRDLRNLMARPLHFERFYREVERLARAEVPGGRVRLAINEWGLDLPEARQHAMDAALYGARLMNVFERSSPLVAMSAVSDLVNGWPGGVIQASRHGVFVTPLYHANALYSRHLGRERLRTSVDGPTFDSSHEGKAVPYLDAVASRSADGAEIYLKLVNTDPVRPIDARIELRGVRVKPEAVWELLAAQDPAATNSFATPGAIVPTTQQVRAGTDFSVRVPARSVSVMTLRIAR
jgi:alpha-L-arabinofuranosidase